MRRAAAFLVLALLAAAPAAAGDAATAKKPAAAAAKAPAADPPRRTAEQIAGLKKAILDGFASEDRAVRAGALDVLLAAWPDTAPILDEALVSKNARVRLEATCVLDRSELCDMRERIKSRFGDADELVRRQAVRAARHLEWPEIEPSLIGLVSRDSSWIVRQEALRGLQDRGTDACLNAVLDGWLAEKDEERRARFKRVLVKVCGEDAGEDATAWRTAVEKAQARARAARVKPK